MNESGSEPLVSVVDDDDLMRKSTVRLLHSVGQRAEGFASAEKFLSSGRARETACLLLDLSMPGMSGLALQQYLAETGVRIPIVFLSAKASEKEEQRALKAGAAFFLRKPVSEESLVQAIRIVLEGATGAR
jgi:FixJ family two-component response regulator